MLDFNALKEIINEILTSKHGKNHGIIINRDLNLTSSGLLTSMDILEMTLSIESSGGNLRNTEIEDIDNVGQLCTILKIHDSI